MNEASEPLHRGKHNKDGKNSYYLLCYYYLLFIHVCIVLIEHYLIAVIWIKSIQRNKVEIIIMRKTDEKKLNYSPKI